MTGHTTSFRAMRRTAAATLSITLLLAACGGSDDAGEPDESVPAPPDTQETPPTEGATHTADGDGGGDTETSDGAEPEPEQPVDKPEVDVPGEAPDELVRTVLTQGSGEPAAVGDTVIVDYVGVRSLDGVEFDNSYDRGSPFPVTLGSGSVIQGWEDGLVGATEGERVQLDIPSDLAYGPAARSDVIRENEPLTFVIDVRAVVKVPDAADAPDGPGVELSQGATETTFVDLVDGTGDTLDVGDTAIFNFAYYRGDNGVLLESNWGGAPSTVPFDEGLLPGLFDGMGGMRVGTRRAITIPPEDGFGPEGNPQGGLPANTDIIFGVDLLAAY